MIVRNPSNVRNETRALVQNVINVHAVGNVNHVLAAVKENIPAGPSRRNPPNAVCVSYARVMVAACATITTKSTRRRTSAADATTPELTRNVRRKIIKKTKTIVTTLSSFSKVRTRVTQEVKMNRANST